MANLIGQISSESKINFASTYIRANGQPIDDTSVWNSKEAAINYATAEDTRAYVGQIISIIEGSGDDITCKAYIIQNTKGDLAELSGNTANIPEINSLIGTGVI